MNIVHKVRNFVRYQSKKPTAKYGYDAYQYHFVSVVEYARQLSAELGGDKEVILIASWLHDIGSVMKGRNDHHITGMQIAEDKLRSFGYPEEKIKLVKLCIKHHRGSVKYHRNTIEEKIVSEADTMSNFDNIAGLFKAAYVYENMSQGRAKVAVRRKLKRKWRQLHFEKSREIVRPRYEAAMILLK
jgi:uncharacterized protein